MLSAKSHFFLGFACCLLLLSAVACAADTVPWQREPGTAERMAAKAGRPLLIFVTSANCSYCRKMEQKTWSDEALARRLQSSVVPLHLDADQHPDLVRKLGVDGFPTTLIYGPDGKLLGHLLGYAPPQRVHATLDQVLAPVK